MRFEPSVEHMLEAATDRRSWKAADSLSGSHFEQLAIGDEPFVVKYVCVDDDWIMRATGDLQCRQLELLRSMVLDSLPGDIDHTIVACAPYTSARGHRGAALLMRNVSDRLVAAGSEAIALRQHHRFLSHMARMHAAYWGFHDTAGLFPFVHHYVFLTPAMARIESTLLSADPVPLAVAGGWRTLEALHPRQARILGELAGDPGALTSALQGGPHTLLHGDWKFGNLGSHADGRTILLDWDRCGEGPALVDLAWYLAVNCDRLPETKEAAISWYRERIEEEGVATERWWDEQLDLALAGAFLQLGWSKAGDSAEVAWWSERLDTAVTRL